MAEYTIAQGLEVRERMNLLAQVYAPTTGLLLDRVDVPAGAACLDVGCGGGHVTIELCRRAGPSGHALGLDLDGVLLDVARKDAADQGLHNVEFRVGRAEDVAEKGVDLAYARMLLMHVSDPQHIVNAMAAAVTPGGVVVVEDCNFSGCFTDPPCPAYEHIVGWFMETVRGRGADPDIGPRLPALLREAGLEQIGVNVVQPAELDGLNKQFMQVSTQKVRDAVVSAGVASASEFDQAHAALTAFTDDPTTVVAAPRVIQSWGRQPAQSGGGSSGGSHRS